MHLHRAGLATEGRSALTRLVFRDELILLTAGNGAGSDLIGHGLNHRIGTDGRVEDSGILFRSRLELREGLELGNFARDEAAFLQEALDFSGSRVDTGGTDTVTRKDSFCRMAATLSSSPPLPKVQKGTTFFPVKSTWSRIVAIGFA